MKDSIILKDKKFLELKSKLFINKGNSFKSNKLISLSKGEESNFPKDLIPEPSNFSPYFFVSEIVQCFCL